jgi:hypothetical protein
MWIKLLKVLCKFYVAHFCGSVRILDFENITRSIYLETEKKMSYGGDLRSFPSPVDNMFGLVSRKGVMRAIELAREDVRLDRIANHDADLAEFATLVKRLAREASRPASTKARAPASDPLVPRS